MHMRSRIFFVDTLVSSRIMCSSSLTTNLNVRIYQPRQTFGRLCVGWSRVLDLINPVSGHATQVKDTNGDERHGSVTGICSMNYMGNGQSLSSPGTPGIITDEDMHDVMVKPLPRGCRLTVVLDCPHSGVPLDLPFIVDTHGQLQLLYNSNVVQQKSSPADVISLSIRKGSERVIRTNEDGGLRKPFIDYMMTYGIRGTYHDIIRSLCTYMDAKGFRQQPQLSSSHIININQRFIICE